MTISDGHTPRDYDELVAAGIDPYSTQPRSDHGVRCWCGEVTWHQMGGCDKDGHYIRPAACDRKQVAA